MKHVNMMIKETPRVYNVLSFNVSKSDHLVIISFQSKLSSFIEKKWGKRIEGSMKLIIKIWTTLRVR